MRKCDVCTKEKADVVRRDADIYLCAQCYYMIKHWLGLSIQEAQAFLTRANRRAASVASESV
jgi:ribosomal protein L37AE/L43A